MICNIQRNTEIGGKEEMHNVGSDYGEKAENVENEKKTLQDMEYGEKH